MRNGTGKTTTIRVLLGLIRSSGGQATLLGGDPWRDAVALHRRLAYVPGDVTLWPALTGGEIIDLLGKLGGGVDAARLATLTDRFELDPRKKARTYSKGNRQKVALIAALASDAELLLLDEPTGTLAELRHLTRTTIDAELKDGTHVHQEVEQAALNDALAKLTAAGVRSLTCRPPTLEEIFLKHYSERPVIPAS